MRSEFVRPPDLLVTWSDGLPWGVEVTRTYLQVAAPVGTGNPAQRCAAGQSRPSASMKSASALKSLASAELIEPLRTFGEALGKETRHIRKRDYTLSLGPSPADALSGQPMDSGRHWRNDARMAILEHMRDDRTDTLKRPGVWLKPGDSGNRWTVAVHPGVKEIKVATCAMLERALREKADALPRWNGNFSRRWLLLLNHYPLVTDVSEVETAIWGLLRKNTDCHGFDGIFWNGCSDSSLVTIPISRRVST